MMQRVKAFGLFVVAGLTLRVRRHVAYALFRFRLAPTPHDGFWLGQQLFPRFAQSHWRILDRLYYTIDASTIDRLLALWRKYELPTGKQRYAWLTRYTEAPRHYAPDFYDCDDFALDFTAWCRREFRINAVALAFNAVHAFNVVVKAGGGVVLVEPQNGQIVKPAIEGLYGMNGAELLF